MNRGALPDYFSITEAPGLKATREQMERLYHRYRFALDYLNDANVLEVACGSGIGLGYLGKKASKVVGGDIDEENLAAARSIYGKKGYGTAVKKIQIVSMDAHELKLPDRSFDLVLLFEAIYYLKEPKKFISEARRVLADNGSLIICTVNKDWGDFHPSPYTHHYFSVPELYFLLSSGFAEIEIFGAFPAKSNSVAGRLVSLVKRIAVRLDLIPGSLAARVYLKRLFLGPLKPLPDQISDDMASYEPPVFIPYDQPSKDYKIIYAVARKALDKAPL